MTEDFYLDDGAENLGGKREARIMPDEFDDCPLHVRKMLAEQDRTGHCTRVDAEPDVFNEMFTAIGNGLRDRNWEDK